MFHFSSPTFKLEHMTARISESGLVILKFLYDTIIVILTYVVLQPHMS